MTLYDKAIVVMDVKDIHSTRDGKLELKKNAISDKLIAEYDCPFLVRTFTANYRTDHEEIWYSIAYEGKRE